MPITIRSGSTRSTGNTRSTSTPARTRKPAAKPAPSAASQRKAKAAAKATGKTVREQQGETRMKPPEGMSDRELAKIVKEAEALASERDDMRAQMDEIVKEVHNKALDMLRAGISMAIVSVSLGMSRQWLYKLMEDNGLNTNARDNGGREGRKRSTRKPAASKPAASKPAAAAVRGRTRSRSASNKPAAASSRGGGGKLTIRSR